MVTNSAPQAGPRRRSAPDGGRGSRAPADGAACRRWRPSRNGRTDGLAGSLHPGRTRCPSRPLARANGRSHRAAARRATFGPRIEATLGSGRHAEQPATSRVTAAKSSGESLAREHSVATRRSAVCSSARRPTSPAVSALAMAVATRSENSPAATPSPPAAARRPLNESRAPQSPRGRDRATDRRRMQARGTRSWALARLPDIARSGPSPSAPSLPCHPPPSDGGSDAALAGAPKPRRG